MTSHNKTVHCTKSLRGTLMLRLNIASHETPASVIGGRQECITQRPAPADMRALVGCVTCPAAKTRKHSKSGTTVCKSRPIPAPTLVMRSAIFLFSKSFANRPGQYDSTLTPAALMSFVMFSACTPAELQPSATQPRLALPYDLRNFQATCCTVGLRCAGRGRRVPGPAAGAGAPPGGCGGARAVMSRSSSWRMRAA